MGYISKKVAAYGQFVLVFSSNHVRPFYRVMDLLFPTHFIHSVPWKLLNAWLLYMNIDCMYLMDMLNWTVAGLGSGDRQVFTDQALRLYPLKNIAIIYF